MKSHILFIVFGVIASSCAPESNPVDSSETILSHRNDTVSFNFSVAANHSNQHYLDTLAVVADSFVLYLRAFPTRGHGTLMVLDERDSTMLTWTFLESVLLTQGFAQRPYRTIITLQEYTGSVWLDVFGRRY